MPTGISWNIAAGLRSIVVSTRLGGIHLALLHVLLFLLCHPLGGQGLPRLHGLNKAGAMGFEPAYTIDVARGLPARGGAVLRTARRAGAGGTCGGGSGGWWS
jgi:hypothetical protein